MIKWFTKSKWSHVAMVINSTEYDMLLKSESLPSFTWKKCHLRRVMVNMIVANQLIIDNMLFITIS